MKRRREPHTSKKPVTQCRRCWRAGLHRLQSRRFCPDCRERYEQLNRSG